jgi:hypothetical protein
MLRRGQAWCVLAWLGKLGCGGVGRGKGGFSKGSPHFKGDKMDLVAKGDVTNDGERVIQTSSPFRVEVTVTGTADFLFHRWSCEGVEAKSNAAKGSKAKKTDDIESYVYRCEDGTIGIPGEYLRGAIIGAAKFRQDPRSPRKSAQDLYKAGIVSLTEVASLGKTTWDKLHQCRVVIQRNAVTRTRPCFLKGWKASFIFMVLLPEYISQENLTEIINDAGRLIGIGDFRPTYGRFCTTNIFNLGD